MFKIRHGVFETNSSSVHSMIMVSEEEYDNLKSGQFYVNRYGDNKKVVVPRDEILEELKEEASRDISTMDEDELEDLIVDYGYMSFDKYYEDNNEYETFFKIYTTKSGEKVYAIGYYGYEY